MRDSIIFYKSFFDSISELPPENALNIYNTICRYVFYDDVPNLVGIEKAIFALIQPQIDANNKRYEDGKKGGRPKKTENAEKENHRFDKAKTKDYENKKPNENENENDNDNDNDNENDIVRAEPETDSTPAIIKLPLNDKTVYPIYQPDIDTWQELYPAVNVLQQLRAMSGWLDANPQKRKTRKGVKRFVNSWLSREQDKGGNRQYGTNKELVSTSSAKLW